MSISQDIREEVEKMSNLLEKGNQIITKLTLISQINVGDTLCVSNLSVMKHKTLYTAAFRWFNDEDRNKSREWINRAFEEYEIYIESLSQTKFNYLNLEKKLEDRILDFKILYERAKKGRINFEKNYEMYQL